MILSKLGSAGVWSSAFSTSIRISRPTRFRLTCTINLRRSSCIRRCLMQHCKVKRPGEQLGQAASRERDVDAIGLDFHAAEQGHERRFDFVRCVGSKFLCDLTASFNQLAPPWPPCESLSTASRIARGTARKVRSLLITTHSRLPAGILCPLERFFPVPVTREVET